MKSLSSRAITFFATASLLFFLSGCASVNKFVTYRPPGKNTNVGIEVIIHPHVPAIFELQIDGHYVMDLHWTAFASQKSVTGSYQGKPVEMRARFLSGTFSVDVFIDHDRAANFTFP